MDDLLYYLSFSYFLGIGPIKFSLLKKHFRSVKKAYWGDKKDLKELIGLTLTEKFLKFRNSFDPLKKIDELKKKEIKVLAVDDKEYPLNLKAIADPPICLYLKGSLPTSNLTFAIVGTRNPTEYGKKIAYKFSKELTEAGFTIISGMAYGIDTIAHRACLDAQGKTVAVLGCGVDIVYPAANRSLYQSIIKNNGAIISEFPPGHTVLKGLFIARNRIISALSSGVMIVEGTKDSGSLITARYAAEQGKEVFAPPSPITSEMSEAPNILLKQGAKLVVSIEDIFEEFDIKIAPKKKENKLKNLTEIEKLIFDILEKKPLKIDDIALLIKKSISETLNIISLLEINGLIEKNSENQYQVKY